MSPGKAGPKVRKSARYAGENCDPLHYGPKRNDTKKEHPDLLPYDQLPEIEKKYDRKTVIEALKAIIAMGYEVNKRQ